MGTKRLHLTPAEETKKRKETLFKKRVGRRRCRRRKAWHRLSLEAIMEASIAIESDTLPEDIKEAFLLPVDTHHFNYAVRYIKRLPYVMSFPENRAPISYDKAIYALEPNSTSRSLASPAYNAKATDVSLEYARDHYLAGTLLHQFPLAHGEWYLFDHQSLKQTFKGIRFAKIAQKNEYLVKIIRDQNNQITHLHIHSNRYTPLTKIKIKKNV